VELALPNANSRVEEQRGELSVTHGRVLAPSLNLQVPLGVEMSELAQSGDAENVRLFTRPKGFASLSWRVDPMLQLVTRLDREVGQLDFFDFISSVNLNQGNGSQGNSEIVPEQAWKLSVTAEKDFKDWGAATLTLFGSDIEDIVDRIPIGPGDGPGNIDSAWRMGVDMDATVKFAKLGLSGTELTFGGEWRDSRVEDPLTGIDRPINSSDIYYLDAELRRDIPQTDWAVGVYLESYNGNPEYTLNERFHSGNQPSFSYAYVEHKDLLGMTGKLVAGNLLDQHDWLRRDIYDPNRRGVIVRSEAHPAFRADLYVRAARYFLARIGRRLAPANAPHFPPQPNAAVIDNASADEFAERFEVRRRRVTGIDEEIAVLFRNLRAANAQAAASGGINDFPG
jgi:hypothetical protein